MSYSTRKYKSRSLKTSAHGAVREDNVEQVQIPSQKQSAGLNAASRKKRRDLRVSRG
jgi:hypothetical protein